MGVLNPHHGRISCPTQAWQHGNGVRKNAARVFSKPSYIPGSQTQKGTERSLPHPTSAIPILTTRGHSKPNQKMDKEGGGVVRACARVRVCVRVRVFPFTPPLLSLKLRALLQTQLLADDASEMGFGVEVSGKTGSTGNLFVLARNYIWRFLIYTYIYRYMYVCVYFYI